MSTNVLKCDKCNIVIDEMLSYIQNKVSVIDEVTLVRICVSSFTGEEIKTSKSLLFDSIPTNLRKIIRKNKGKEERDLSDIINLFKSADPDDIPVFVARQLEKLPPITFDHLDCTKLLKDLVRMQATIDEMKLTYATQDQLRELKVECLRGKNDTLPPSSAFKVNTKRGAWLLDSGPMGLSHLHNSSMNESANNISGSKLDTNSPQYREIVPVEGKQIEFEFNAQQRSYSDRRTVMCEQVEECEKRTASTAAVTTQCASPAVEMSHRIDSDLNVNKGGEDWQKVTYRKKRPKYRYSGKSGTARDSECNFKAADKMIPIFITNIHSDTTEDDIIKYIRSKTQETVCLEIINMKKARNHKAYKFLVSRTKLSLYLDENFWPQGIVFRRFMNYKRRNPNGTLSASDLHNHL